MNKKKVAVVVATVGLLGTLAIGGTLAYFTDSDEATNVITMGLVDGELTEEKWDAQNPDGVIENIVPGDVIVKDPTLTMASNSEDAYARFVVSVDGLTAAQAAELKFTKNDEAVALTFDEETLTAYFYVEDVMNASETYVLFDEVETPTTWGNEMAAATFNINVKVELVQADNFNPATDWEGLTVETYNAPAM